jgi:phosphoribosyl-dephospho-CoA transferase
MKLFNISDKDDPDADQNEAVGEASPKEATELVNITTATATKITGALKLKGYTDKTTVTTIVNKMAQANFQVPALMRLTEDQGTELYTKIVATKKEDLDMLVSME